MVDCSLMGRAVEERCILVTGFCWIRFLKQASVELNRNLKVYNAILKITLDCIGSR